MSRFALPFCAALAASLSLFPATSGSAARTADEAKAFAERAVAHIQDVGRDKAFADFSRPDGGYVDGELYMFCYAADGTNLAHGGNPAFVGKNLLNVKDPDGKLANAELIRTGLEQGTGWVDFRWPNPVSHKIEAKSAYVIRVDPATVCGSGYYKG
jgi:signal transduction histidine kinase